MQRNSGSNHFCGVRGVTPEQCENPVRFGLSYDFKFIFNIHFVTFTNNI